MLSFAPGRRRAAIGMLLAACLVLATSTAAAVVGDVRKDRPPPLRVEATPFRLRGGGDATALVPPPPIRRFTAAEALVPELVAYAQPDPPPGSAPVAQAPNPTWEGYPLVVSVIETSADGRWVRVRLPLRPNGTAGWVPTDHLRSWEVPNRVEVSIAERRLRVFDGDSSTVLFETDVAVGRGNTPTPAGDFYIDIVNPLGGHPVYGWGQLSVAGFSEVLERFAGGIGQIALHGWNDDDIMGSSVSNGCVRMRNADIARVAELAPLGTPVIIRP